MLIGLLILIYISTIVISLVDSQEFKYVHCCEYSDIVSDAIQAKCPLKLNGNSKEEHIRQANCLAEQLNLLIGDHIDVKKFDLAVNKIVGGNAEAKVFYHSTMVQCEKIGIRIDYDSRMAKKMPNLGCSFKTFSEMTCLGNALAVNCPQAKTIKSPECDAQRKLFKGMSQELI